MKRKDKFNREKLKIDSTLYFLLHNILSIAFFFLLVGWLKLFEIDAVNITYLITSDFWSRIVIGIMICMIISDFGGKYLGFLIMKYVVLSKTKKSIKSWLELNSGINDFSFLIYFLYMVMTSLLYPIIIVGIITSYELTRAYNILVLIYIGLKIGLYLLSRWIIKANL